MWTLEELQFQVNCQFLNLPVINNNDDLYIKALPNVSASNSFFRSSLQSQSKNLSESKRLRKIPSHSLQPTCISSCIAMAALLLLVGLPRCRKIREMMINTINGKYKPLYKPYTKTINQKYPHHSWEYICIHFLSFVSFKNINYLQYILVKTKRSKYV